MFVLLCVAFQPGHRGSLGFSGDKGVNGASRLRMVLASPPRGGAGDNLPIDDGLHVSSDPATLPLLAPEDSVNLRYSE
jgi:hypothetical protein